MISADEFLKQRCQKQAKGKLLKFKNEILKLRKAGLTLLEICEFLKQNNVVVSQVAVSKFCTKHAEEYEKDSKVIVPKKKTEQKPIADKVVEQPAQVKIEPEQKAVEPVKPKSNWTPPPWAPKDMNIDDLI
ncbi:hypothetical protein [Advenella alkanexedens]|uniref:hypothetical protein n=1 Tax=Advenella alkanexedens TaxID=1481665 RepID=UPI002675E24C|nr:hypothetical protein [Advenella alkanexedens]WKU18799.1 hypothetical protein Q3V95_10930 [Advenella alkanexedens]